MPFFEINVMTREISLLPNFKSIKVVYKFQLFLYMSPGIFPMRHAFRVSSKTEPKTEPKIEPNSELTSYIKPKTLKCRK